MCIAIIKPMGIDIPSLEVMTRCFNANKDGAGFAMSTKAKKNFIIRKGLMTVDEFTNEYNNLVEKIGAEGLKNRIMAFHFRIGTHGSKSDPEHTHPFPVSEKTEDLEAKTLLATEVSMHNGILTSWGDSAYGLKKGISDTMEFIRDFVAPLKNLCPKGQTIYDREDVQKLIGREVAGSRFTIMYPDGSYVYWGKWIENGGCLYSNDGFKEREPYRAPAYPSCADVPKAYGTAGAFKYIPDLMDSGYFELERGVPITMKYGSIHNSLKTPPHYRYFLNLRTKMLYATYTEGSRWAQLLGEVKVEEAPIMLE